MQLPESHRSHDQETLSRRRFESLLAPEEFIARHEETDYGTDIVVEIKINLKYPSNYRFHVQLKSTEKDNQTKSGYRTKKVEVGTLNYLLNHPKSIIVLHVIETDTLYWEWVDKVWRDAQRKNIDFRSTSQRSYSCKLRKRLDKAALQKIATEVVEIGQVFREMTEIAAYASPKDPAEMLVQLERGSVTDIGRLKRDLKECGFLLANLGHFHHLDKLISLLPGKSRSDPHLACFVAYSKYLSGQYCDALSWIPRSSQINALPPNLRDLSLFLRNAVERSLGMRSQDRYEKRRDAIMRSNADSVLKLQIAMQRLTRHFTSIERVKEGISKGAQLLSRWREKNGDSCDDLTRMRVEIIEWELDGRILLAQWMESIAMVQAQLASLMFQSETVGEMAQLAEITGRTDSWYARGEDLKARAIEAQDIMPMAT